LSPPPWLLWPVDASAAVMIFFVLSGYVIGLTNQHEASGPAVRSYVWRRLVRLIPINTCAVFLTCALATSADWRTALANLFFLENYADYAGTLTFSLVAVSALMAGTLILMWIGEQIDEYGIGNGVSLIIMAGILSRVPQAVIWPDSRRRPGLVGRIRA
jgi:preprotein translocase subunit SecY